MKLRAYKYLFSMALLGIAFVNAPCQVTTADLTGNIVDASGAAIPHAAVSLKNLATQEVRQVETSGSGGYSVTFIQPGHYSITVNLAGFKTTKIADINLRGGDHARGDATMEVGGEDQSVSVTAQSPMLQADSSTVLSSIGKTQTENLPLATRNITSLITYTAGANEATSIDGLASGARPDDRRQTSTFSVNGQDDVLNNQMIDGTDNNERIIGTVGVKPSLDSVAEVNVQTNDYEAEVGRAAGGVVSVVTQYGTNQFHGDVYEYFKNDVFDARNPFNPVPNANTPVSPKAKLRQNDFGGSAGGPIRKDKTFFFFAYENFRQIQGALNPVFSTVPTLAEEQAGPAAIVAADPATQGLAVDPIAATLFGLYPAPNTGAAGATTSNYLYDPTNTQFGQTYDARVDHQFNQTNSIFVRYTNNRVNSLIANNLPNATINGKSLSPGSGDYGYTGPAKDNADNYQINYIHTFNPSLLLELKAAYTRINNSSDGANTGTNAATLVGFGPNVNYGPLSTGLPLFDQGNNLATLGDARFLPLQDLTNTFQYNGAVTKTIGNHVIKAGAALIRRQAREAQNADVNGNYSFSLPGDTTQADSLASFLVGAWGGIGRTVNLYVPDYRTWEPGFYAQDTWKINPKLTINFGARYDVFTPFTEVRNHISNFDPATGALLVAGVNGVSDTAGILTDYSNFAPRIGFSATVLPKTVVRGGFGMSYYPGNFTSNAALKNAPFTSNYSATCASSNAVAIENFYLGQGAIQASQLQTDCASAVGQLANPGAPSTLDSGVPLPQAQSITTPGLGLSAQQLNFKSGLISQFNLLVERQVGNNVFSVGYVGAINRHSPEPLNNINVPNPALYSSPAALLAAPKPFPTIGSIAYYLDEGTGSYHSLQATFQRRIYKGLSFQGNYTWAHALNDASGISDEGQQGWGNADPFNIRGTEYGNSDLDLRHRFVLTSTYEVPFAKTSTGLKKELLAGYVINEIYVWNTGNVFSITDNFTGFGDSVYAAGVGSGPDRPEQVASAKLAHPSISEWFNRDAFVEPEPGTIPNTGRNTLYGPHFQHIDLSIFKNFTIWEKTQLQFRAESFNVTNTPAYFVANDQNHDATTNLVPATGNAPSSAFGQIVRTNPSYTPRNLQFALKLLF